MSCTTGKLFEGVESYIKHHSSCSSEETLPGIGGGWGVGHKCRKGKTISEANCNNLREDNGSTRNTSTGSEKRPMTLDIY